MTYIRRAIKYFIQTCLLLAIIIGILMLSGMVSKDISVAFTTSPSPSPTAGNPSGGSSPSSP